MTVKTIAIAADHGGVELKSAIISVLKDRGIEVFDFGTNGSESVDYPDYAQAVAKSIIDGQSCMWLWDRHEHCRQPFPGSARCLGA